MTELFQIDIGQLPPVNPNIAVASAVVAGLLYCFLGYRLLKFVIGLTGFVLAGAFAGALAAWASQGMLAWMAIAAVAGGLCGAVAMLFLFKLGVFALGVLAGALVAYTVLAGQNVPWMPWAVIGAAAGGGLGGLLLERPVVTLATAAIGSWLVVHGALLFVFNMKDAAAFQEWLKTPAAGMLILVCWGGLALAGTIAQLVSHKPAAPEKA